MADERERGWVANTAKGGGIAAQLPPAPAPSKSSEKRAPPESTLFNPTTASKAASKEGIASPPKPPEATQERYVNEQYADVQSRLYETTASSENIKREKAVISKQKAFTVGSKAMESSPTAKPPPVAAQYAEVSSKLHAPTAASEGKKNQKPEPEKKKSRKSEGKNIEPYSSHVLVSTKATESGAYRKPEPVVEPPIPKTKPIRRDSHLLTPTPASLHGQSNDSTLADYQEPEHIPKLVPSEEYEYVRSRLHEDTAAHKNSVYVKKEQPVVNEREANWNGTLTPPQRDGQNVNRSEKVDVPAEYKSVSSRLHQKTAATINSAYVKPGPNKVENKTRRKSEVSRAADHLEKGHRKSNSDGHVSNSVAATTVSNSSEKDFVQSDVSPLDDRQSNDELFETQVVSQPEALTAGSEQPQPQSTSSEELSVPSVLISGCASSSLETSQTEDGNANPENLDGDDGEIAGEQDFKIGELKEVLGDVDRNNQSSTDLSENIPEGVPE